LLWHRDSAAVTEKFACFFHLNRYDIERFAGCVCHIVILHPGVGFSPVRLLLVGCGLVKLGSVGGDMYNMFRCFILFAAVLTYFFKYMSDEHVRS
jgi:hypothetical protein